MKDPCRCEWATKTSPEVNVPYHDMEWGVPLYDDRALFEFLMLDGFQAGLSWATILKKRPHFREVFDNFEPEKVARYGEEKIALLLQDTGIIRNRLKVRAAVRNAGRVLDIQDSCGSFSEYIWQFVEGQPIINSWTSWKDVPAASRESDLMSRDLTRRGFSFVGPTICYAFMQAAGLVNDHETGCFRYRQLSGTGNPEV